MFYTIKEKIRGIMHNGERHVYASNESYRESNEWFIKTFRINLSDIGFQKKKFSIILPINVIGFFT